MCVWFLYSLPSFQALSQVNSTSMPACFSLVLAKPIPVAMSVIQAIQEVTGMCLRSTERNGVKTIFVKGFLKFLTFDFLRT